MLEIVKSEKSLFRKFRNFSASKMAGKEMENEYYHGSNRICCNPTLVILYGKKGCIKVFRFYKKMEATLVI